ncbi:TRAPPC10_1 [Blepharisma stoltei]|uniref:TRAPPC10/Trs130 N-terminal domain-containing protein n=1 Tax=Blepharisma stoltei TaxID=1481888 RepID=A0AAU9K185_9CILI|nr:unnamed protein product [Blepharisma stoltei]
MELHHIPVAYYDEAGIWPLFSKEIIDRTPIPGATFSTFQGEIPLPPLNIRFIKHEEAYWEPKIEDAFLKPYLWIFLLHCNNFEIYKRDIKHKLRELVNAMGVQRVEWLVLYVPSLTQLGKSQHSTFAKVFEKIQKDIFSMFGLRQCVRLFSQATKSFMAIDQPSKIRDDFWADLIKSIGKGVSAGLCNRMALFLEELSILEQTKDFYKYCLTKEGLAIMYSLAGLNLHAKMCYDDLLAPPEPYLPLDFIQISMRDLQHNSEMTMQDFRNAMETGSMSELSFREYVFSRQKAQLEYIKAYVLIGELSLNLISTSMRLFRMLPNDEERKFGSVWVYQTSLKLAEYLQQNIDDIDEEEVRIDVHYSVGLLLSIARSRLERLASDRFGDFEIFTKVDLVDDFALDKSPVKIEGKTKSPQVMLSDSPTIDMPEHGGDLPLSDSSSLPENDLNPEDVLSNQFKFEDALLNMTGTLYEEFSLAKYSRISNRYRVEQGVLLNNRGFYEQAIRVLKSVSYNDWNSLDLVIQTNLFQCYIQTSKLQEAYDTAMIITKQSHCVSSAFLAKMSKWLEEISYISENFSYNSKKNSNVMLSPVKTLNEENAGTESETVRLRTGVNIEPLDVHSKIYRQDDINVISICVTNQAHTSLRLHNWKIIGCDIQIDSNQEDCILRTGQQQYMAFLASNIINPEIVFKYSCVPRRKDKKANHKAKISMFEFTHVISNEEIIPCKNNDEIN